MNKTVAKPIIGILPMYLWIDKHLVLTRGLVLQVCKN